MGRRDTMTEFGYKKMLYEVLRMNSSPGAVLTSLGFASSGGKKVLKRALDKYPEYAAKCKSDPELPHPVHGRPVVVDTATQIFTAAAEAPRMDLIDAAEINPRLDILTQMKPSVPRDHLADKVQTVLEMMIGELGRRGFEGVHLNDLLKAIPSMTTTMRLLREQSTANVATVSKQVHEIERRRKAAAQSEAKALVVVPDEPSVPNAPPQSEPQDQRSGTQRVEGDEDADATFQSNVGPSTPLHEGGQ